MMANGFRLAYYFMLLLFEKIRFKFLFLVFLRISFYAYLQWLLHPAESLNIFTEPFAKKHSSAQLKAL